MNDDALAFLEKWIEDNAVPTPAKLRGDRAETLAAECFREGAIAGFSEEELEEAASELSDGADLAALIEVALEKAEDEEADDEEEEDEV
jgi:hypothetical protein